VAKSGRHDAGIRAAGSRGRDRVHKRQITLAPQAEVAQSLPLLLKVGWTAIVVAILYIYWREYGLENLGARASTCLEVDFAADRVFGPLTHL
jgi:hypothetical protein